MPGSSLTRSDMLRLFDLLNTELATEDVQGELYLVAKTKRSPAPLVQAASKRVRTQMRVSYAWFARAFRAGAEYLRGGDRLARFPLGSFPPGLPFVRAGLLAIRLAT